MQLALALPGSCTPCSACLQDTRIQNSETLCFHVSLRWTVSHGQELAMFVSSTQGLPPGPLQQGAPLSIGMQRQPASTMQTFTILKWLQEQSSASQAEDKLSPLLKKKKIRWTFRDLTPCAKHSLILGAAKMNKIQALGCFARPRVRWLIALCAAHHPRGTGLQSGCLLHREGVVATWNRSRNELDLCSRIKVNDHLPTQPVLATQRGS